MGAFPAGGEAQIGVFFGGGLTIPVGDYGGYAGATYRLGDPEAPGVFLIGKVGALVHDFDTGGASPGQEGSDTNFSGGAGAGFMYVPFAR
jgi:hypothetical protein